LDFLFRRPFLIQALNAYTPPQQVLAAGFDDIDDQCPLGIFLNAARGRYANAQGTGGGETFWSSTEFDADNALTLTNPNDGPNATFKSDVESVQPVREF